MATIAPTSTQNHRSEGEPSGPSRLRLRDIANKLQVSAGSSGGAPDNIRVPVVEDSRERLVISVAGQSVINKMDELNFLRFVEATHSFSDIIALVALVAALRPISGRQICIDRHIPEKEIKRGHGLQVGSDLGPIFYLRRGYC